MRVRTLDAHVGGAAVRLVVAGLPAVDGETMAERQASFEARAAGLALGLTREPRGHAGLVGVALTLPERPDADAGMLFFTGAGPRRLSGHAAMAAAALALDHGIITPRRPGAIEVDTDAGPIALRVIARTAEGRVRAVRYEGPPASVLRGGVRVTTSRRTVGLDLAWSGSEVVAIVEGEGAGVPLSAAHTLDLRQRAQELLAALEGAVSVTPPGHSTPSPATAVAFVGPPASEQAFVRTVMVRADGTIARSASASATAAVSVVLAAMGLLPPGAASRHESLSGTSWIAEVTPAGASDGLATVAISGEVFETGALDLVFDRSDPMTQGALWT